MSKSRATFIIFYNIFLIFDFTELISKRSYIAEKFMWQKWNIMVKMTTYNPTNWHIFSYSLQE